MSSTANSIYSDWQQIFPSARFIKSRFLRSNQIPYGLGATFSGKAQPTIARRQQQRIGFAIAVRGDFGLVT